jgi:hypothetical protein
MKLITVGCSFTEGQELKFQDFECYTNKLAEQLNLEYYNFGSSGASNDYIFRKVFELIETNIITKEDIIIIQWTNYNRKELPIVYEDKKWYYYPPNGHVPMWDKKLFNDITRVQNEYYGIDLQPKMYELKDKNMELLDLYTFNFLHDEYQKNTTKNYINSLYTYLEHFGYNHLHFFGWGDCVIDGIDKNKSTFLKENFGNFTNTGKNRHPNKTAHNKWAKFLNDKILEFKFINPIERDLNTYVKKMHKLKIEIEEEIPILLKNHMEKLKIEFEKEIDDNHTKIILKKERQLQEEIDKIILKKERQLQEEIDEIILKKETEIQTQLNTIKKKLI